jgi:hypothetical protein
MVKKSFLPGLYIVPAIVLISFTLFFTSCSKEDSVEPSVPTEPTHSVLHVNSLPELFGFYSHPDYLTIGRSTSENRLLNYLEDKGGNMVNCYARSTLTTSSGRSKFAAFCRKAVNSYRIKLITCDIRETSEITYWNSFYNSYPDLRSYVSPLTEKEPWVTGNYSGCFSLLRLTKAMCNRYGAKFFFYEGWMGKNYAYPQRAVDSMVYYCDGIFLTNYVSVSDYLSRNSGYGKWDNRMKNRIDQGTSSYGGIVKAAKKFNKTNYPIIELQSLEREFLYSIYATSGSNRSFYGSMYDDAKALYNQMDDDVLTYTSLKGKCLFQHKYVLQAQPN